MLARLGIVVAVLLVLSLGGFIGFIRRDDDNSWPSLIGLGIVLAFVVLIASTVLGALLFEVGRWVMNG